MRADAYPSDGVRVLRIDFYTEYRIPWCTGTVRIEFRLKIESYYENL